MKIVCIGGGPAGLYLAILLKKADPRWQVIVLERNRPGDTFGFGVVFSDATLGALAEADRSSYEEIARNFAHWDDIEVHLDTQRGGRQHMRSTGHGFCGLERRRLLEILVDRCRALGVELCFDSELAGLEQLAARGLSDADLIVAADGVSSGVRDALASAFEPQVSPGRTRFVWLGSTLPFRAFTFLFKESRHGLWRVHAYRYNADRSTFIAECTEETFRRTELGVTDEDATVAYLEEVFAAELGGHRLIKNRSIWRNFPTVQNRRWHTGNVVLLGDAAHTAHFSIGSGTKLAMEDAIALARELAACGGGERDIPAALRRYEAQRRPEVQSLQRAAAHSAAWFEHSERYLGLPPQQFLFSLLTRSLRVTHGNLRRRDPSLVADFDAWFARSARAATGAPSIAAGEHPASPPMFAPFALRDLVLAGRVASAPLSLGAARQGCAGDTHLVQLGSWAAGGVSLVFTERCTAVDPGRGGQGDLGLYTDEQVAPLARICAFVHERGGAVAVPLWHAGSPAPGGEGAAETAVFARAARRAHEAGVDLLELDLSGVAGALRPAASELAARARGSLALWQAVRASWPESKPLGVRLPALAGEDELLELARLFRAQGCDLVSITPAGTQRAGRLATAPVADRIRNELEVPTLCEGGIASFADVNSLLAGGRADLCGLGRALLFDPAFVRHAAAAQGVALPAPLQLEQLEGFRPRFTAE